jgi:hypothetical protein
MQGQEKPRRPAMHLNAEKESMIERSLQSAHKMGQDELERVSPCCMDQSVNAVIAGAIGLMRCGRNSGVPSPACGSGH